MTFGKNPRRPRRRAPGYPSGYYRRKIRETIAVRQETDLLRDLTGQDPYEYLDSRDDRGGRHRWMGPMPDNYGEEFERESVTFEIPWFVDDLEDDYERLDRRQPWLYR